VWRSDEAGPEGRSWPRTRKLRREKHRRKTASRQPARKEDTVVRREKHGEEEDPSGGHAIGDPSVMLKCLLLLTLFFKQSSK
jgi:hypothetical protein